jgi:ubiquitin C-terminal hydrolase
MEQSFVAEFRNVLRELEANPNQPARPAQILRLLVLFNPIFSGFQQADAQECINTILEVLHTGLLVNINIINNPGVGQSENILLQRAANERYAMHFKQNGYSIVEEIFGSQFLSKLICQNCGNVSYAHDAYTLVPVPVPNHALTLYDCIDQFITPEIVEGVSCEKCNTKSNAIKQLSFWTLPHMLIVQLKRFDHRLKKIDRFVQAPLQLNMTQYITHPRVVEKIQHHPNALQLYNLSGVICHSGQLGGGHYTAKCKRPSGVWMDFNDATVRPFDVEKDLQSPLNYIFFYEMTPETKKFWP